MRVLVTGANGFLGYYLVRQLLDQQDQVIATGKGDNRLPFAGDPNFQYASLDFTDPFEVHDIFEKYQPQAVVHAGAISKPDDCEKDQWAAYVINVEGTLHLLANAAELKAHFIFISTDFVFDGEKGGYSETDSPNPINYYGKTKLEAEEAVGEYEYAFTIIRTVLVYGKPQQGRGNILSVVREKLEKGETYKVVGDQWRTPTYVEDLASAIVAVIDQQKTGLYHIAGKDGMTPYQMACQLANYLKLPSSLLQEVSEKDFSQPARRPLKTGFNIDKAIRELGYAPVSFEEGLRRTVS